MRRRLFTATAVLALVAAACGGNDDTASDSSNTTRTTAPAAALEARTIAPFGKVLTANGRTLYVFANDEPVKPKSTCNDSCASNWPPLLVTGPGKVADDLDASLLGETTRDDGAKQHTWNGWPLYLFAADTPGETKGQGVGGVWHMVSADGNPVLGAAATTTTARGATTTTRARTTATTVGTSQTAPPATSPPATSPPTTAPPATAPPTTIYYYP